MANRSRVSIRVTKIGQERQSCVKIILLSSLITRQILVTHCFSYRVRVSKNFGDARAPPRPIRMGAWLTLRKTSLHHIVLTTTNLVDFGQTVQAAVVLKNYGYVPTKRCKEFNDMCICLDLIYCDGRTVRIAKTI